MTPTNPEIDALFNKGKWQDERASLRILMKECALNEELKWGKPCYTFQGANVALLFDLKDYCGVGFFKGALLNDSHGILHAQGAHSQAMRLIRFTDVADIRRQATVVKAYVLQAIAVEKAGLKVHFREKDSLAFPDELHERFGDTPGLESAFAGLTPGRQRAYTLYFTAAKQSATRSARIAKHIARILDGKGLADP